MPIFFYGSWAYSAIKNQKISQFSLISICLLIVCFTFNLSNYQLWGIATAAIIVISINISLSAKIQTCTFLKWFSKLSFTIFLTHYMVLL